MSLIKKSLLLFAVISLNAFATGSFICEEYNPQTGAVVNNGMFIHGVFSWSYGAALVGKVKIRGGVSREQEIELDMSQYKNNGEELYYLSVMDLPDTSGKTVNQRVVLLETKNVGTDESSMFVGKLNITYTNFTSGDIPVACFADKKK